MTLLHQAAQPTLAGVETVSDADNQWFGDMMILQVLADSDCVNEQEREVLTRWMAASDRPSALHQQPEPVAVVEMEPDYWSRGHFYEGKRHVVRPTAKLDELPIGTPLFALQQQEVPREPVAVTHTAYERGVSAMRRCAVLVIQARHESGYSCDPWKLVEAIRAAEAPADRAASPSTTQPIEAAYTWPPKACPCGSVQRDGCEEHGCKWERDPSLVPMDLRRTPSTTRQQEVGSDTTRLDHLQRTGSTVELLPGFPGDPLQFRIGGLRTAVDADLREAIDKAVAAVPSTPEKAGGVSDALGVKGPDA